MCGIYGITLNSKSNISSKFFNKIFVSLLKLSESRGKEASGIALLNRDTIKICKSGLPGSKLITTKRYKEQFIYTVRNCDIKNEDFLTAIGHSRLVTNGSEIFNQNNQPVIKSDIVGIHNGIVVNVEQLWQRYFDEKRVSELDTEIILTLFRRFYNKTRSLKSAIAETFSQIYGMCSIAFLFKDLKNLLLATNNGSIYYVLGEDRNSVVFASERHVLSCIIKKNRRYFNLEDIVHIRPNNACLVNLTTTETEYINFSDTLSTKDFNNISKGRFFEIEDVSITVND